MNNLSDYLFSQGDLSAALDSQATKLREDIEKRPENYILNVNEEEFIKHLVADYWIEALTLFPDNIGIAAQGEVEEEIEDYGRYIKVRRQFIDFELPFTGETSLFKLRPNQFDLNPPRAKISNGFICWRSSPAPNTPADRLKSGIDSLVASIKKYCECQRPMIEAWNQALDGRVRSAFKSRKDRLLKNVSFLSDLGIPMKKRSDPGGTYSVAIAKKKITTEPPKVTSSKFEHHPTLAESDYQEILQHLRHMSHTIERMPDAFQKLGEEDIRTQFLMHLNGAYEGNATGETFSHQGKTDIFLKVKDRPAFIAECKFWEGSAAFPGVIDQLLGYLTWRETKAAILLFVRNLDVAQVSSQIPALVSAHKNFTRKDGQNSEGEFRFIMKSARDESLPLILTVMVFHFPKIVGRTEKARITVKGKTEQ